MKKKAVFIILLFTLLVSASSKLLAAPDAVTDLAVVGSGFAHITLSWSVPYDIAADTTPSNYELRVSSYIPIVGNSDWDNYSTSALYPYRVLIATSLITQGESQSVTITGLVNGQSYFFAIKASTDNLTWSALDTSSPEPFTSPFNTAPDNVSGHNYMNGVIIYSSTPTLSWDAPAAGDDDEAYGDTIASYTLDISTDSGFTVKTVKDGITTTYWITNTLDDDATYYWRVKAYDSGSMNSAGYLSQANRRFVINGVNSSPSAFALTAPINSAIVPTNTPNFQWGAATEIDPGDVVTYILYYSTCQNFAADCSTIVPNITLTNYTPLDNLIENAAYFWKVNASDQWGKLTMSSSTGTLRVNGNPNESPFPFVTLTPANGAEIFTSSATLTWQAATDPDPGETISYTVDYSSADPAFSNGALYTSSAGLVSTQYTSVALQEDTTYWWRVSAYDPGFLFYRTAQSTFTVNEVNNPPNAFDLISSSGIISTALPVFKWQAAADPDNDTISYAVYYSSYADFSAYISSAGLVTTSWAVLSALKENTTYYWKVEVRDVFSNFTVSNQTWSVIVDAVADDPGAFSLASPADGASTSFLQPSLDWNDTSDTDPNDYINYYIVHYSTAADFSVQSSSAGLVISSFTFTAALVNNTSYYWKVAAVSALSGSATSQTWQFYATNLPPADFSLISSSGNTNTATPILSWQAAADPESDAVTYRVVYSSYSGFTTYQSSAGHIDPQFTTQALEENRVYYWYVEAIDSWGNTKQSTQIWSFGIDASPEAPVAFSLVSPADGSAVNTQLPSLDWQDTTDPDPSDSVTYTLWYSEDPAFSARTEITGLAQSAYTVTANLTQFTSYYWRVYAVGAISGQRASADWTFYVGAVVIAAAPSNFRTEVLTAGRSVRLFWNAVSKNNDGNTLTNLAGYKIFKAYTFDDAFTVIEATSVPAGTQEWTDNAVNNMNTYYIVRAYNVFDVDGDPSQVQYAGTENRTMIYDTDRNIVISFAQNVAPSTVTISISRLSAQETGDVLRSFRIAARDAGGEIIDYKLTAPIDITFKLTGITAQARKAPGSETLTTGIFWNNGVEWVYFGGEKSGADITARTSSLGSYQLRSITRSTEFKPLTIWPKIITPNADTINDEFNMTFENPTLDTIEGYIYDLSGSQTGKMSLKTEYWLIWDGKDEAGKAVPAGLYIYQVKCGEKIYNGTVVVAK